MYLSYSLTPVLAETKKINQPLRASAHEKRQQQAVNEQPAPIFRIFANTPHKLLEGNEQKVFQNVMVACYHQYRYAHSLGKQVLGMRTEWDLSQVNAPRKGLQGKSIG